MTQPLAVFSIQCSQCDWSARNQCDTVEDGVRIAGSLFAALLVHNSVAHTWPSITCPFCGATSYNANDIAQRYCGACHRFQEP